MLRNDKAIKEASTATMAVGIVPVADLEKVSSTEGCSVSPSCDLIDVGEERRLLRKIDLCEAHHSRYGRKPC